MSYRQFRQLGADTRTPVRTHDVPASWFGSWALPSSVRSRHRNFRCRFWYRASARAYPAGSSPLFETFFSFLRFPQLQSFGLLYGRDSDDPIDLATLRRVPSRSNKAPDSSICRCRWSISPAIFGPPSPTARICSRRPPSAATPRNFSCCSTAYQQSGCAAAKCTRPARRDAAATDEIAVMPRNSGSATFALVLGSGTACGSMHRGERWMPR